MRTFREPSTLSEFYGDVNPDIQITLNFQKNTFFLRICKFTIFMNLIKNKNSMTKFYPTTKHKKKKKVYMNLVAKCSLMRIETTPYHWGIELGALG